MTDENFANYQKELARNRKRRSRAKKAEAEPPKPERGAVKRDLDAFVAETGKSPATFWRMRKEGRDWRRERRNVVRFDEPTQTDDRGVRSLRALAAVVVKATGIYPLAGSIRAGTATLFLAASASAHVHEIGHRLEIALAGMGISATCWPGAAAINVTIDGHIPSHVLR